MSEFNNNTVYSGTQSLSDYMMKVYTKMGLGLLVTAAVALAWHFLNLPLTTFMYLIVVVLQFGVVISLSAKLTTMDTKTANGLFFAYSALTGITFSVLIEGYGLGICAPAFLFTAVMFFSCVIIGKTTNRDLSQFSSLFMGALIALVIASLFSMFIPALRNSLFISYAGILIFLGLTAWDSQKIRAYYEGTGGGYGQVGENLAVYGAFQLYLDFINIFLYVLRILGSRRRD